jgi:hypothetical protein
VLVDVQRDHGSELGQGVVAHRGHVRRSLAGAAAARVYPDALNLHGVRRGRPELGLEDDLVVFDVSQRVPTADHLRDASSIERGAAVRLRRHSELLGVHRHAGGVENLQLVWPDQPYIGGARDERRRVEGEERLVGAHASRRPPLVAEQVPQRHHLVVRPHQRAAMASLLESAGGEGAQGGGRRESRRQVGRRMTERDEAGPVVEAPHLATHPARLEAGDPDPVVEEDVGDRVSRDQALSLREVVGPEDPQPRARAHCHVAPPRA